MADSVRIGSGSIILVPDARQFRRQAETDLRKIQLTHQVLLRPDLGREYRREAQAKLDAIRLTHPAYLTPRLQDGFRREAGTKIEAALAGLSHTVNVNVNLSTALASAQMTAWRREQEARPLRIRVETSRGGAVGAAGGAEGAARRDIDRFGSRFVTGASGLQIPASMDMSQAERDVRRFAQDVFGNTGGGRGGASGATGRFRDLFRIRPSMDAADIKSDPRLREQLRRASYEFSDSFRLRIQPNIAGIQARLPLGGLGVAAIPEMALQVGQLTAALTQLSQAALIVPGALAAIGAVAATGIVGISGMKEAWKALSTEQKDSAASADQVRTAQREVTNAVQDQERARRQLADAIENEQRRQRDLQLQLRGAKLSEAEAILEVQDAAAQVREGNFANRREYDSALLRFEQSKLRLLEVRNKNADTAKDVAKNERTGVLGSDQVLNATQNLTNATERLSDASRKLAEGGSTLGAASQKAQEAMNKLSPSARQFIQTMFDLKPQMEEFARSIQEPLTRGLGPAFQNLFNSPTVQTNLRQGMAGLAGQMNQLITATMGRLGSPETGGFITRIFGNTSEATARFRNEVLGPLITGLGTLTAAGTDSLPRITTAMGELATRFSNFITQADKDGSLKRWVDEGLDAFTQLGRIAENLFRSFEGISRAFGTQFLTNVTTATAKLAEFLNSGRGQADLRNFISETTVAFNAWKPILADLPGIAKAAFDGAKIAVAAFLPIIQTVADVIRSCPGLIQAVATAFVAWKTIGPVVTATMGILNNMTGIVQNVGSGFELTKAKIREGNAAINETFEKAGLAHTGMNRLSTMTNTLGNVMGASGPLVAALATGAILALQSYINKQQDAIQTTENLKQETQSLISTLDQATGLTTQSTRDTLAKKFTDFKPAASAGLGGNVLAAAAAIGVGGAGGADLVTAALPAGGQQFATIMGQLKTKLRPSVKGFIDDMPLQNRQALKESGLTEEQILDAFLGDPDALAKFRQVQFPKPDADLGALARRVQAEGGDRLNAALVGQALSQERFGITGAGQQFSQAATAARPQTGQTQAGFAFGPNAITGVDKGTYSIATNTPPTDPAIAALLQDPNNSLKVTESPAGAERKYLYTFGSAESARKYISGIPQFDTGGDVPGQGAMAITAHGGEHVFTKDDVAAMGGQGAVYDFRKQLHFDDGGAVPDPFGFLAPLLGNAPGGYPHLPGSGPTGPGPGGPTQVTVTSPTINIGGGSPIPDTAGQIPGVTQSDIDNPANRYQFGGPQMDLGERFKQAFFPGSKTGKPPDPVQIAAKFGQILMGGVAGFFGLNTQYLNDIDQVLGFGLSKLSGSGYTDPAAQSAVEGAIVGTASDGSPIYYLPTGQQGTALPGVDSGTGGAGGAGVTGPPGAPGTTPGGAVIGTNPASKANYGGASPPDISPASLKSRGIEPLYAWNQDTTANPAKAVPGWVNNLASQFGLVASTYATGGTLHQGGYAFDFNDPDSKGGDSAKLDAFATFIQQHLSGQTLQLIHANPQTGQKWGIAAGSAVGPGTSAPQYFNADWGGHGDHVHWATDVPVAVGSGFGAAALQSVTDQATGTGANTTDAANAVGPSGITAPGAGTAVEVRDASGKVIGTVPAGTTHATRFVDKDGNLIAEVPATSAPPTPVAGGIPGIGGGGGGTGGGVGAGSGRGGLPQGLLWSPTLGVIGTSGSPFGGSTGSAGASLGTPAGLNDLQKMAYQLYMQSGLPPDEWEDFKSLIQHESGWSPTAQNPGSTAHGLGQFLDSTWASVGISKTDDPRAQLMGIFAYLKSRQDYHGSPRAAWQLWQQRSPHWYASGGVVDDTIIPSPDDRAITDPPFRLHGGDPGIYGFPPRPPFTAAAGRIVTGGSGLRDDVPAMLTSGEFVVNKGATAMFRPLLEHINGYADGGFVQTLMNAYRPPPPPPPDTSALQSALSQVARPVSDVQQPSPPSTSGIPPDIIRMLPRDQQQNVPGPPGPPPPPTGPGLPPPPPPPVEQPQEPAPETPPRGPMQPVTPVTPSQTSPLPSGAPGAGPTRIPTPAPGERPYQPIVGAPPPTTDHELPAVKTAVTSGASALGNMAAAAAGAFGMGPAGSLASGAIQEAGKIVNGIINVGASALVGTLTPGTTDNPYGTLIKGVQAPGNLGPGPDMSTHYHGDLYSNDMDDFFRRMELRDSVQLQSNLAAKPNFQ